MIKHGLTVKASLLFKYLSVAGVNKHWYKRALDIENYEVNEFLYRDGEMFWNLDDDWEYNCAFLKYGALNKAVTKYLKYLEIATVSLEGAAKEIASIKSFKIKNNRELSRIFNGYIEHYLLNMPFLFSFWNTENILINQLTRDFQTIFGLADGETNVRKILIPSRATYFAQERNSIEQIILYAWRNRKIRNSFKRLDVKQLVKKIGSFPTLSRLITEHLRKFSFTTAALQVGEPMKLDDIVERIKGGLKANVEKQIVKRLEQVENDKKETQEIARETINYPEIYQRVKVAQDLFFWKNQRIDTFFKADTLSRPLFEEIGFRMGLTYTQFVFLTLPEIQSWFKDKKLPVYLREINKRREAYSIHLKDGKIFITTDPKKFPRLEHESKLPKIDLDKEQNIKGTIAYKGLARGKVRLVFTLEDIKKVNKGEVLVTTMTRPEMMIALEKAVAFVTNEGGMLSHAAIVSRELKKPCIIGTGNATRILSDGDLIEVDANNGIVKILRKGVVS